MPDPKDIDQKKNILVVGGDPVRDSILKRMMDRIEEKIYKAVVMPLETMMPFLDENPNPSTYANQSPVSSLSKEDFLEQIHIMERMLHEKCGFNDVMPSPTRLVDEFNFRKPITAFPSTPSTPLIPPLPPIHSNPNLTEQFRFPTSKKKRIRKKWSKDPRNFRPSRSVYMINPGRVGLGWGMIPNGIFCHPIAEEEIRKNIVKITNIGS